MDPETIARLRALREAKLRKETDASSVNKPQQQPPLVHSTTHEQNVPQPVPSPSISVASDSQRKSRWDSVAPIAAVPAPAPLSQPYALQPGASSVVSATSNASTNPTYNATSRSSVGATQTAAQEAASLALLGPAGQARVQRMDQGMNEDEPPRRAFSGRKRDDSTNGYLDPELFLAGASSERPLDATSCPRGYRLLLKMGWSEGTGLGKTSEGMLAPLATTVTGNDTQLGIGKGNEYNEKLDATAAESGDKRRRLEEGDASSALLRANHEAKMEAIAVEKKEELRPFFCDWCQKQYASVSEWEKHLQSYGHTHTRNMKELRLAEGARRAALGGSREEKLDKEAKRAERELAKRMKAAGVPALASSNATVPAPMVAAQTTAAERTNASKDSTAAAAAAAPDIPLTPGSREGVPIGDAASSTASNGGGWGSVNIDVDGEVSHCKGGGGWGSVRDSAVLGGSNVEASSGSSWGAIEDASAEPALAAGAGIDVATTGTATSAASKKAKPAIQFGFGFKKR